LNEQRIANCISMQGNEKIVAVEWPKLRDRVFEFLCQYQWRDGEYATCLDDDARPLTVEQVPPDWMLFFTRRHPLPLKFVLPDNHIGDAFGSDKTVLCIAPIRGVIICHEWWLGESVLVPRGSSFLVHAETWHWTDVP
jgi:hypothetical protein